MKAYLDVNVVFDLLLTRHPFFEESLQLIALAEGGRIDLYVDAHTFIFAYAHLLRFGASPLAARTRLAELAGRVEVVSLDSNGLHHAFKRTEPRDLEDAGQVEIALATECKVFLTRDVGLIAEDISVQTPHQFLSSLQGAE